MGVPEGCKEHGRVWLCSRRVLVGIVRAIPSVVFGIYWAQEHTVSPCRASISSIHGPFSSYSRLAIPGRLIASLLRLRDTRAHAVQNVLGNVYLISLTKNLWYEAREQLDSGGGGALSQGAGHDGSFSRYAV